MKKPSRETRKLSFKVNTLRALTASTTDLASVAGGRVEDGSEQSFPIFSKSWP